MADRFAGYNGGFGTPFPESNGIAERLPERRRSERRRNNPPNYFKIFTLLVYLNRRSGKLRCATVQGYSAGVAKGPHFGWGPRKINFKGLCFRRPYSIGGLSGKPGFLP